MTEEPRYVDDPFEEEDASWQTTSGIDNLDIIEGAQKICRRHVHPFHSKAEKNKWLKIDRQVTKGIIGKPWIDNCFEWAKGKNSDRLIITMPKLASLILNKARMTDWNASQAEEHGIAVEDERDLADEGF
jgi:hypothetical protein